LQRRKVTVNSPECNRVKLPLSSQQEDILSHKLSLDRRLG